MSELASELTRRVFGGFAVGSFAALPSAAKTAVRGFMPSLSIRNANSAAEKNRFDLVAVAGPRGADASVSVREELVFWRRLAGGLSLHPAIGHVVVQKDLGDRAGIRANASVAKESAQHREVAREVASRIEGVSLRPELWLRDNATGALAPVRTSLRSAA